MMLFDDYKKLGHRFKKRRWLSHLKAFFQQQRAVVENPAVREKTCLIVRIDRIGDYVLFRDFLRSIRNSDRFRDYHLTLCGNVAFRDIAETCDAEFIDEFIWLDISRFKKFKHYYVQMLRRIREFGFETVLHPTLSRDIFGDLIVGASAAPNRIGVNGDFANQSPERRKITDAFYTELIIVEHQPQFEFDRNKQIIEKMLGQDTNISQPTWPRSIKNDFDQKDDYAVFIPGAGSKRKRWHKFEEIAEFVFRQYRYKIVFVGKGKRDRSIIQDITKNAHFDFQNLCDTLSLIQAADLLAKARLVFGNDSGLVHVAAVQSVPTVCVTPGAHAFRFNVYPDAFNFKVRFLFPPQLERMRGTMEFANYSSQYAETFDVCSISAERVKMAIEELLERDD